MVGIAYNLLTPIVDFNNIYVYLGMYNTYLTYFYGSISYSTYSSASSISFNNIST